MLIESDILSHLVNLLRRRPGILEEKMVSVLIQTTLGDTIYKVLEGGKWGLGLRGMRGKGKGSDALQRITLLSPQLSYTNPHTHPRDDRQAGEGPGMICTQKL